MNPWCLATWSYKARPGWFVTWVVQYTRLLPARRAAS